MERKETSKGRKPVPAVERDGRRVRLDELPLVAFGLICGHLGREYGVLKGDQVWCGPCMATRRVTRILAR